MGSECILKVELFYDPVVPETTVRIDEQMSDNSDIYGFLYPVRNCLLQTWLTPQGSWKGLGAALEELARGESTELIFYGRKADFSDVNRALNGVSKLKMSYVDWQPEEEHINVNKQIDELIGKFIKDDDKDDGIHRKSGEELFPEFFKELKNKMTYKSTNWYVEIKNETDYNEADKNPGTCCLIDNQFIDSFEKLKQLEFLLNSMRRGADMIACCIPDKVKRLEIKKYAGQYDNFDFRFVDKNDRATQDELLTKYGTPYLLRDKRKNYIQIFNMLAGLLKTKDELKERIKELEAKKNMKNVREIERSRLKLNWIARKTKYIDEINKLVHSSVYPKTADKGVE